MTSRDFLRSPIEHHSGEDLDPAQRQESATAETCRTVESARDRLTPDGVVVAPSLPIATVALQLLDQLIARGVDTVFGIPGGASSPLYGGLLQRPNIRVVNGKHETSAVFMAMGYTLATGKPGIVLTTAGPGITNALTGLASAYYDSIPILIIAGDVPTTSFGRGALQESSSMGIDALGLVHSMTKISAQVLRAEAAPSVLHEILDSIESGRRGPAFLSLPLNVGNALGFNDPIVGHRGLSFEIDQADCDESFDLLAQAQRPFILAGAGIRGEKARSMLVRLAETSGARVAVTPKGKGVFPEDHSCYLGLFGFGGHGVSCRLLDSWR